MTTNKFGVTILVPHVTVFDVVHRVGRVIGSSHTNHTRQSLIAQAVDALAGEGCLQIVQA